MKVICKKDLEEMIEKHRLWLLEDEEGEHADLSYTDLRGVDLS